MFFIIHTGLVTFMASSPLEKFHSFQMWTTVTIPPGAGGWEARQSAGRGFSPSLSESRLSWTYLMFLNTTGTVSPSGSVMKCLNCHKCFWFEAKVATNRLCELTCLFELVNLHVYFLQINFIYCRIGQSQDGFTHWFVDLLRCKMLMLVLGPWLHVHTPGWLWSPSETPALSLAVGQWLTNVEKISKLHRNVGCHSLQPLPCRNHRSQT